MNKNKAIQLIKEELKLFSEENQLAPVDMSGIIEKVIKKLESIDMSLDLIYGALVDSEQPIAVTRARQRAFGRVLAPRPPRSKSED
tara:strand:+ start:231 stop:488 length:258 start_codon:yes stop_codon:yes gene_type:complete